MSATPARARSTEATGRALRVLLLCTGVGSLVVGVVAFAYFRRHGFVVTMPPAGVDHYRTPWMGARGPSALWIPLFAEQGTAVVWLIWQHQATANLWARAEPGMRTTPGWAVGWWFIPVANLWMPFVAMRELDRRSMGREAAPRSGALVGVWWLVWVAAWLLPAVVLFGVALPTMIDWAETVPQSATVVDFSPVLRAVAPWALAWGVLQCLAALLAFLVVARIDEAQAEMFAVPASAAPTRPDLP